MRKRATRNNIKFTSPTTTWKSLISNDRNLFRHVLYQKDVCGMKDCWLLQTSMSEAIVAPSTMKKKERHEAWKLRIESYKTNLSQSYFPPEEETNTSSVKPSIKYIVEKGSLLRSIDWATIGQWLVGNSNLERIVRSTTEPKVIKDLGTYVYVKMVERSLSEKSLGPLVRWVGVSLTRGNQEKIAN